MDIPLKKKRFTASRIGMLVGGVLLIGLILFVLISSGGNSKLNVDTKRLTISTAEDTTFQEDIPVNGVVMPITTVYLDALEGGRVEEKFVENGAMMKKGEPILRLSNSDLELSLVNQETSVYNLLTQMQISQNAARQNTINKLDQLTNVEHNLIEAERLYKLNEELYGKGVIAKQKFLESRNNYEFQKQRIDLTKQVLKQDSISTRLEIEQAENSYRRTQNALELMRKKVGELVVKAPVDGQLTSFDTEIGQSTSKGERLGQIDVLSGYKVSVNIDEHYISRIYSGQFGSFTLNGKEYSLKIVKVYNQVSEGAFKVDMQFDGEIPKEIRRGQTLQIRVALSREKRAIVIPKGRFFQHTGGNWIFKVTQDGNTAYKVNIVLGSQNTEYYEVLQGLKPGDQVITSSYDNYKEVEELELK